ncbi:hypothetical protein O6U65_0871 [Saccharomyces cerevisiae synthetic construct]|uniref:Putative uncharacterized protein YER119C-A n=1 Tax=Saccharomyces cerevisiae (strain ATCC 204508 / S288c) TaxID=559292 RepID=YE119_YEAST|nr:RecName: Full=Putative uncharacterized protein YER119C-A [Saccharomyces cerevisiae S288C]AAC03236.1 Yer119c-ap [Saccharomyces cerevisiae]WNV72555.1 hypothetical protein O6U65_0871 [Saccharomyces cerevisiae synthetic construct]
MVWSELLEILAYSVDCSVNGDLYTNTSGEISTADILRFAEIVEYPSATLLTQNVRQTTPHNKQCTLLLKPFYSPCENNKRKKKSEGERVRSPRTFRGSESLSIQQLEVYRTTMVERRVSFTAQ